MIKKLDGIKPGSVFYLLAIVLVLVVAKLIEMLVFSKLVFTGFDFALLGLASVSVFFQAIFFNKVCIEYDVLYKHSYLPGAVFALLNVFNTIAFYWQDHLVLWLFLIIYQQVVSIDAGEQIGKKVFNIAFLCAIIGFFIPFFYFSPILLLLTIMVYKIPSIKEVLAASLGFAVPVFLVFSCNFLFSTHLNYSLTKAFVFETFKLHWLVNVWCGIVFLIFVWGTLKSVINYFKNNNLTRKMLRLTVYFLLFTALILALNAKQFVHIFCIFVAPLSVGLVYAFFGSKLIFWRNLVFYIFFATSVAVVFIV